MDVDTLLTRQMELHTSVRHPPKNPQGLVQLVDIMRNYKNYFESLRRLADQFSSEPETVFQAFMYISVGGSVNFDRQHQDGSVPMHQAKVLARSNAIDLATTLRKEMPNPELMVYVGLSRDLRTTLRVKMEDGNDLKTAEASVCEAVEYLNYIDRCADHNPDKLFAFYMAEDPNSLTALLDECSDPLASTQTMSGTVRGSGSSSTTSGLTLNGVLEGGGLETREPTALPAPLSSFLQEVKRQCELASDTSYASGGATRRLKAAQVLLDWVTAVPAEYFAEHAEMIVGRLSSTLSLLATEKRSAICRVGCEIITVLLQRLSTEPVFLDDVHRGTCSTNPETFSGALAQWTGSLAKGTYVTVAAISTAADAALRVVTIQSHGHICVVKKLLTVLTSGTQTELRRKCLGYLALCATAAHAQRPERVRDVISLLSPVAVEYVSIGDSPSRKMARALCSVLRVLAPDMATSAGSSSKASLVIADERVEHLVQQERPQVEPAVREGPQELEVLLFEADAFVSSTRSSFSASTPRTSGMSGMRGRGRAGGGSGVTSITSSTGMGPDAISAGYRRPSLSASDSSAHPNDGVSRMRAYDERPVGLPSQSLASHTPAGSGASAARQSAQERTGDAVVVPSPHLASTRPLGEVRSPTRRATQNANRGSSEKRRKVGGPRRGSTSPQRDAFRNASVAVSVATPKARGQHNGPVGAIAAAPAHHSNGVYDTDAVLRKGSSAGATASAAKANRTETTTAVHDRHATGEPPRDRDGKDAMKMRRSNSRDASTERLRGSSSVGSSTSSQVPVFPPLVGQPRRNVVTEPAEEAGLPAEEAAPRRSGEHRPCVQPSGVSDRTVPLSLRASASHEGGVGMGGMLVRQSSTNGAAGGAEPVSTVRISRSLRRKIEENKASANADSSANGA